MFDKLKSVTSRSSKNKRLEPREEVDGATVEIWGETYPVKNWSHSGFLATSCPLDRREGDEMEIYFSVPLRDGMLEFSCRALVVNVDKEKQELAAMFVMMDNYTRQKINEHFARLSND